RDGDVLMHHRAPGRRADDAADLVADRDRQLPPAFAPRADAALAPHPRVLEQARLGRRGHRGERVVDQVDAVLQDREAIAVREKLVHGMSVDQLTLLDWKRRIFALYAEVREDDDARRAWRHGGDVGAKSSPRHPRRPPRAACPSTSRTTRR